MTKAVLEGQYEQALRRLVDVLAVKVILNTDGAIETIRLLVSNSRDSKQVAKDVLSVLYAQYHLQIDVERVKVVRLDDPRDLTGPGRFGLLSITIQNQDLNAIVQVKLGHQGEELLATTEGISTKNNLYRLIAEATVEAVSDYFASTSFFHVDDIKIIELSGKELVIVSVGILSSSGEELLSGSSFSKGDLKESAARATLDALNRRLRIG